MGFGSMVQLETVARYRCSVSTDRIAILSVETKSVHTFRLFSPGTKMATQEINNPATTRLKSLLRELLLGDRMSVHFPLA